MNNYPPSISTGKITFLKYLETKLIEGGFLILMIYLKIECAVIIATAATIR